MVSHDESLLFLLLAIRFFRRKLLLGGSLCISLRFRILRLDKTYPRVTQYGVQVVDIQFRIANSVLPVRIAHIDLSVAVGIQIIDEPEFLFILIELISRSGKSLHDDFFFDDAIPIFIS